MINPKIKFKEYESTYKSIKIKDLDIPKTIKDVEPYYLEIGDVQPKLNNYTIDKTKPVVSGSKKAKKGTILVSTVRPTRGAICELKENVFVSSAFCQINTNNDALNQIILQFCLRQSFLNLLGTLSEGGTYPTVNSETIKNIKITISDNTSEQQNISELLKNIDNLILKEDKNIKSLKTIKKSMLENMFPNENNNIPKLRFNGYTNTWEQRKLSELGEISTGSTPSTANPNYYSEDGIPWVTPTDITSLTISDTPRKLSKEGANVGRVVPANTILCTCIASIGKNTLLTVKGSFNQQINSITPNEDNDAYFLLTESGSWSNTMKKIAASGTMQIVNKSEFSELKTMVPSLTEQRKIGDFFRQLDNLITLHQRKCDKLKQIKSALLDKLFV